MKTPKPEPQKLQTTYDTWYSKDAAPHWEEAPGKSVVLEAIQRCLDPQAALSLLDIGCGTGSFLDRIGREVVAPWRLHGVDFSRVAIAEGQQRHPDLTLTQGDATALEAADASFDAVTCYGSWEHFPTPAPAIAEASRVLVPGGRIFAMIPALGIHRTDRDDEGWYEDTEVPGTTERQLQWNLTRESWARMFTDAGIHLFEASLAQSCGAHKPGVFFFGQKAVASPASELTETAEALLELSHLAKVMAQELVPAVEAAAGLLAESLRRGGKILACGNGGSAADAQHFVAELVGRLKKPRASLAALSLSVDPSVVTAIANDYGYDLLFARQVEGLGQPGDVLLVISTSGRSANVLAALDAARQRGLSTIALLGRGQPPDFPPCDQKIHIPHDDAQRVQEAHTAILHAICGSLELHLEKNS
jgi:phosphoheptose isomerase